MKIAFFHELPYGGARRAVLEFGREFSRENEVDLFYIDDKKEEGIEKNFSHIKFIESIPKKWEGHDWRSKLYKDSVELLKLYKIHRRLAKSIDFGQYDFVFVHGSKYTQAPFLLRFLKTSSVYYCQEPLRMVYEPMFAVPQDLGFGRKAYETLNRSIRKAIDRVNIKHANILIANSTFTKKNIKDAYNLNSVVCYMGVDTKRFFSVKAKKKYDILFVGSKDEVDGYFLLKEAISEMNMRPKVRWLLRENEWISDDNVLRTLYSESKILTCLGYREPFGLLPLEAQACGTPIVAVREGGYMDTVKDHVTGVFVKRNSKVLSKTLSNLLKDNEKLEKLSQNSRTLVEENWTWETNAKKLLKTIINGLE